MKFWTLLFATTFIGFCGTSMAQTTNAATVGRGVTAVKETSTSVSNTANQVGNIGKGLSSITNAGNNIGSVDSAIGGVNSALHGVNNTATAVDKITGSTVGNDIKGLSKEAGSLTNDIGEVNSTIKDAAGNISNVANSGNNITSVDTAIGGANSALTGTNNTASALDKLTGSNVSGDIKSVTKEMSSLTGSIGDVNSIVKNVTNNITSITDIMQDPQAVYNMVLSNIDFRSLAKMAVRAAEEQIVKLFATQSQNSASTIPISTPGLQAQRAIEETTKKEMSEIDKKIQEEKNKQLEIIGGKPATPAPQQTGVNNNDAEEVNQNPAKDNCPAYMAQFSKATSIAYDIAKKNILPEGKKSKYAPGQKNWNSAVDYVKSNFYIKDKAQLTPAEKIRLTKKRQEYFYEVNSNLISSAIMIQQALIDDATSISQAPTSGCSIIDDLNINTQTLITISKQTIADIALQISLLEFEAVRDIAAQDILLSSEPVYEDPFAPEVIDNKGE